MVNLLFYFKLIIDDILTEVSGGTGTFSVASGCLNIGMQSNTTDHFTGKISCIQVDGGKT